MFGSEHDLIVVVVSVDRQVGRDARERVCLGVSGSRFMSKVKVEVAEV